MTVEFESDFDELGRVNRRTLPGGFEVDYSYSSSGDLQTIEAEDKNLWECTNIANLGKMGQQLL